MKGLLARLLGEFPNHGRVTWVGVRPAKKADMLPLRQVNVGFSGLEGDRLFDPEREVSGKRAVTLIQAEHFPVIEAFSRTTAVASSMLRRNIVVEGINLLALRGHLVVIGSAVLEINGPCAPCSRMEETLGRGGYNAMRGHGGVTASVIEPGCLTVGDTVRPSSR